MPKYSSEKDEEGNTKLKLESFEIGTPDAVLIYPESEYPNAEAFFANFPQMGIPFMDGYSIQVVDDKDADGKDNVCLRAGAK